MASSGLTYESLHQSVHRAHVFTHELLEHHFALQVNFEILLSCQPVFFCCAAIEVLIFVIARKMVVSGISGLDLLAGVAALVGLVAMRFYFISPKDQKAEKET